MPVVRVSVPSPDWWTWLLRQSPGRSGAWGGFSFARSDDPACGEPDYWVVLDDLSAREAAKVAPERVVFVTCEPQSLRSYPPPFLAQFGLVVTSHARITGPNVVHSQTALMWHAGVKRRRGEGGAQLEQDVQALGYDDFRATRPEKTRDLSVVCSAKSHSDGHVLRLSFVEQLQEHFGDRLDWFGKGIRPIEDKWEALAPYRFHISLENTAERDYWTEKLADAYLGWAFPFYWGCTNLGEYFEQGAFRTIDPAHPQRSIEAIETAMAEGITAERLEAIERARALVLERYNFFPAIASLLDRCADGRRQTVRLRPQAEFLPRAPLWRRTAGRAKQAFLARTQTVA
ncbi:MAG TPA: glycosyltransferase family 10 [Gaiellaceae bacterium]|nr:glycosyltransferase family 10 [Gaiellaceae bacterium]